MTARDLAVIPTDDEICLRQASRGPARKVFFGAGGDVRVEGEWLVDSIRGERYEVRGIGLPGAHNQLNACASIAMAADLGASSEAIDDSLGSFRGLSHRMALRRRDPRRALLR